MKQIKIKSLAQLYKKAAKAIPGLFDSRNDFDNWCQLALNPNSTDTAREMVKGCVLLYRAIISFLEGFDLNVELKKYWDGKYYIETTYNKCVKNIFGIFLITFEKREFYQIPDDEYLNRYAEVKKSVTRTAEKIYNNFEFLNYYDYRKEVDLYFLDTKINHCRQIFSAIKERNATYSQIKTSGVMWRTPNGDFEKVEILNFIDKFTVTIV